MPGQMPWQPTEPQWQWAQACGRVLPQPILLKMIMIWCERFNVLKSKPYHIKLLLYPLLVFSKVHEELKVVSAFSGPLWPSPHLPPSFWFLSLLLLSLLSLLLCRHIVVMGQRCLKAFVHKHGTSYSAMRYSAMVMIRKEMGGPLVATHIQCN